jgi:hypothetical protein
LGPSRARRPTPPLYHVPPRPGPAELQRGPSASPARPSATHPSLPQPTSRLGPCPLPLHACASQRGPPSADAPSLNPTARARPSCRRRLCAGPTRVPRVIPRRAPSLPPKPPTSSPVAPAQPLSLPLPLSPSLSLAVVPCSPPVRRAFFLPPVVCGVTTARCARRPVARARGLGADRQRAVARGPPVRARGPRHYGVRARPPARGAASRGMVTPLAAQRGQHGGSPLAYVTSSLRGGPARPTRPRWPTRCGQPAQGTLTAMVRGAASHPRPASAAGAESGPNMARSSAQRPGNGRLGPWRGCPSPALSHSWPVWRAQPSTARPWRLVRPRHPSASPIASGSSHQAWPAEASVLCSCGKWRRL